MTRKYRSNKRKSHLEKIIQEYEYIVTDSFRVGYKYSVILYKKDQKNFFSISRIVESDSSMAGERLIFGKFIKYFADPVSDGKVNAILFKMPGNTYYYAGHTRYVFTSNSVINDFINEIIDDKVVSVAESKDVLYFLEKKSYVDKKDIKFIIYDIDVDNVDSLDVFINKCKMFIKKIADYILK